LSEALLPNYGFPTTHRALAALLAASQLACLGPIRQYPPAGAAMFINSAAPAKVSVELANGSTVELTGPQVVLDSLLTGWTVPGNTFVGYPLTDVRSVWARERSVGRTVALVGLAAVGVTVLAILAGGSSGGDIEPDPDDLNPPPGRVR
jgi:hypothetical protein